MATKAEFFFQHNRKSPPNALINPYRTGDGRWLLPIAAQPNAWRSLAKAIGMPELLNDSRFADETLRGTNAAALVEKLDRVFASHALSHWTQALDAARVIYAVIEQPNEIVGDPQRIANTVYATLFEPLGGAGARGNSPLWLAGYGG
jgi:crotonobetainyl-CoA:carnitine CoA-transferase CaiB-like acyl-CoA transferase